MTDMTSNEFPWAEDCCLIPDGFLPEISEEAAAHTLVETARKTLAGLEREMTLVEDATEYAFELCQREVNFCLNNKLTTRLDLATQMSADLLIWTMEYAATEGFGMGVSGEDNFSQLRKLLPVCAVAYLRSVLLLGVDTCTGVICNIMARTSDGIEELTAEQERLAEDYLEHFVPSLWAAPHSCDMGDKVKEDTAIALGRAVARSLASDILSDNTDELTHEVASLDDEGLPVFTTAFLAAASAMARSDSHQNQKLASALYAVMGGSSEKDTGTPSLTTPAGIVDFLLYELTEEGVRYFSSLPFRRGYEWHDCKNHIIVPNKSDEVILDHLLREGVLMPFYERVFQGCVRKDSYDTYEEAREQADEYEMRDRAKRLRVYHCPFCGKYHLTRVQHYASPDGVDEGEELERRLELHGAYSRDFLLVAGAEFLKKNKKRIIFRIRQEWERRYGGRRYDRRRAA